MTFNPFGTIEEKHSKALRYNVGCGPFHAMHDWTNVDIRSFAGVDLAFDVTRQWPVFGELDFVYGEHFLEHLEIDQAFSFLDNAYKGLRVGGIIRLSTPSLEWVLSTHIDLKRNQSDSIVDECLAINRAFYGWGHKFLYTKEILSLVLISSGFQDLSFCSYGESGFPALQCLEKHPGFTTVLTNGRVYPSVWIVEATKNRHQPNLDKAFRDRVFDTFSAHVLSGH